MSDSENKVVRLAAIVGGFHVIADMAQVSRSLIVRWKRRGRIDPAYNTNIKSALADHLAGKSDDVAAKLAEDALSCLEVIKVCECCGQPLEGRRQL